MNTYLTTCIYVWIYMHTYTYVYTYQGHTWTQTPHHNTYESWTYILLYVYMYEYICIYIHINIHIKDTRGHTLNITSTFWPYYAWQRRKCSVTWDKSVCMRAAVQHDVLHMTQENVFSCVGWRMCFLVIKNVFCNLGQIRVCAQPYNTPRILHICQW